MVVPSSMKSPTEGIPSLHSKMSDGLLFFDDEEQEPSTSGSISDQGEDSLVGSEPPTRKSLRKHFKYDEDSDEDIDDGMNLLLKAKSCKKPSIDGKQSVEKGKERPKGLEILKGPTMQEAFQPGATPVQSSKRRF